MKVLLFLPLTFLAGDQGLLLFLPYLLVAVWSAFLLRRRRFSRRGVPAV